MRQRLPGIVAIVGGSPAPFRTTLLIAPGDITGMRDRASNRLPQPEHGRRMSSEGNSTPLVIRASLQNGNKRAQQLQPFVSQRGS